MKFMHLSDLHLGKYLIETPLRDDQAYILDQIVDIARREQPQAVLIAGDVYDRSNPPAEAMVLFSGFLEKLTRLGCKVMVISGNHDSSHRVAYLGELVRESGVYLSPVYDGSIEPVTLNDDWGEVDFWLLPFVHPEVAKGVFPEETIKDANDAVGLALSRLAVNTSHRNVILSHQFIAGSRFDAREQKAVGTLDNVNPALYDAFDYVALGHIHGEQAIGRPDGTMRYCGTPLKYSKREALSEKSVTLVELGPKGDIRVDHRALKPLREVRLEKGLFDELIDRGPKLGQEDDYYFITLTDEDDPPHAAARLRERFGKVLAVDYDNSRTRANSIVDVTAVEVEDKSPMALMMELYQMVNNREMGDEEKAFFERVVQEMEGFEE